MGDKLQKSAKELREKVEEEIRNHPEWCSSDCKTFLPKSYRRCRIIGGHSAETVQSDYDMCHTFR